MKIQVRQLGIRKWVMVKKLPIGVIEWRDKTDYYHWKRIERYVASMSEPCDCMAGDCTHAEEYM